MDEDNDGDGFVSIDLDDENEECDICHQATNEQIHHVILSDEFTIFEGSYEKYCGVLTKAHQICLDKWAEIIERNLKLTKENPGSTNDKNEKPSQSYATTTNYKLDGGNSKQNDGTPVKNCTDDVFYDDSSNEFRKAECNPEKILKRKNMDDMLRMNCEDIKEYLSILEETFSKTSSELVNVLQLRDQLSQEISGQRSLIEQLVKMQKQESIKKKELLSKKKENIQPRLDQNVHIKV